MKRRMLLATLVVGLLLGAAPRLRAADSSPLAAVSLNADDAAGRPVEELTKKSVARDYVRAWRTMAAALEQNRADLIDNDFVGVAADKLRQAVAAQAKAGLRTRYIDRGHKIDVLFYSPEGLSIELRDTAQLEMQVLDGDKVVHSEQFTMHYLSLMTPTEVRWKVRLLQAVPGS